MKEQSNSSKVIKKAKQLTTSNIAEVVYGANDGIITTFAIVASVEGAKLGSFAVIAIGIASLFADGISMAASDYLSTRTEYGKKAEDDNKSKRNSLISASFTFIAFVAIGSVPLLPYLASADFEIRFYLSMFFTALALVFTGAFRSRVSGTNVFKGALEMLVVGGGAATIAFFIGQFIDSFRA